MDFIVDRHGSSSSSSNSHSSRSPTMGYNQQHRHHHHHSPSVSSELRSVSPSSSNNDGPSSPGSSGGCSCEVCGKQYKHRSCLQKHMWEHHDAWEDCLKYNLTKHQQVQMMEAAQVLVGMMAEKPS